ncbi:hypothetical protein BA895_10790 [Humibacillus sp. DSM 29435]|nr:hypothetical protein BA895_10790 [Humibacillus sp. DSM 29435]
MLSSRPARVGAIVVTVAALLSGASTLPASAASPSSVTHATTKPTVVLVHGAWADSSSWNAVIRRLIHDGYPVTTFATPLQSLSGDSSSLRDLLASISGPVVLVGHSYGGAVITDAAAGSSQVKALVYLDAFAPDEGEPAIALAGPDSALNLPGVLSPVPLGAPTPTTELFVDQKAFVKYFANDLPRWRGQVLAATQRPVTFAALTEPSTAPAWKTIPSWYEIGTIDKVLPPAVQRSMANRAGAHISTVRSGHLPMVSAPKAVTSLIEQAARS